MSTPEEAVFPGIPVERIPTGPAPTGRIPNVPGSEIVAPGPSALSEEDAEAVNVIKGELAKGRSLEELHGLLDGDPEMQDFLRTGAELGLFEGDIPPRPVLTETDREFDRIIGQPALPPIPPSDAGSQLDVIDQDREGFAGGIAGGAVGDVAANALNVQRAMKRGQLGMATFPATVTSLIASGLTGAGNIFEEQTGIDISRSFPHPVFQGADLAFGAIHDLFTPEDINGFEFPDDDPPRSALDGLSRLRPFESTVNALSQEGVPEIFRPDPRFPEGTSNTQDFIATLGLHFAENIGVFSYSGDVRILIVIQPTSAGRP